MNITIILVLDDNDMKTETTKNIDGFPSKNPYKYDEIDCNGHFLELNLLHIPGRNPTVEITMQKDTLYFNSKYKIKIRGQCLIAISHHNTPHANEEYNIYFTRVNYNQITLSGLPLFPADYSKNGWQYIDQGHSISASKIKSTGIDNLIEDFESRNCQYLMTLYNNFIAEE
jgi:hypothetical protein